MIVAVVQVHRTVGPDEDYEFESRDVALVEAKRLRDEPFVRRVVLFDDDGRVLEEL